VNFVFAEDKFLKQATPGYLTRANQELQRPVREQPGTIHSLPWNDSVCCLRFFFVHTVTWLKYPLRGNGSVETYAGHRISKNQSKQM
jgi:hypothetical protein